MFSSVFLLFLFFFFTWLFRFPATHRRGSVVVFAFQISREKQRLQANGALLKAFTMILVSVSSYKVLLRRKAALLLARIHRNRSFRRFSILCILGFVVVYVLLSAVKRNQRKKANRIKHENTRFKAGMCVFVCNGIKPI